MKILQSRTENYIYELIDDIAEEMEIGVPFYPEVYDVRSKEPFELLGLPEIFREHFETVKKEGLAYYIPSSKIILTASRKDDRCGEEAGHFLHMVHSGIKLKNRFPLDQFALGVLLEMFGFFCSKLVMPERKNSFYWQEDQLDGEDIIDYLLRLISSDDVDFDEVVHAYGYNLGDRLFNAYLAEEITLPRLKRIFYNDFRDDYSSLAKFLQLNYNILT